MPTHPVNQDDQTPFLPGHFILGLKKDLDDKRRLLEDLPRQIEELAKRYEAAMIFAPPGFDPDKEARRLAEEAESAPIPQSATLPAALPQIEIDLDESPTGKVGWRRAILNILGSALKGLPHKEIVEKARNMYALPPSNGEKAFYNAIAKLVNAGQVIKHGNLLYTADVLTELKASGALPELPGVNRRAGSSAEFVAAALREYPQGLTGPQLRNVLSTVPGAPKSLFQHGQYIYNILAPMMGAGEVIKNDGIYKLSAIHEKGGES